MGLPKNPITAIQFSSVQCQWIIHPSNGPTGPMISGDLKRPSIGGGVGLLYGWVGKTIRDRRPSSFGAMALEVAMISGYHLIVHDVICHDIMSWHCHHVSCPWCHDLPIVMTWACAAKKNMSHQPMSNYEPSTQFHRTSSAGWRAAVATTAAAAVFSCWFFGSWNHPRMPTIFFHINLSTSLNEAL